MDDVEFIARAHHMAWVAYQIAVGQPYNEKPTKEQLEAIKDGVRFQLANPNCTPKENHDNWMKKMKEMGYVFDVIKDPVAKTHPDMIPYEDLPEVERRKDNMDVIIRKMALKLFQLIPASA